MEALSSKVAIITGACRGIGRATALAFIKEGAKVLLIDLDDEDSPVVFEQLRRIRNLRGEALFRKADVSKWEEVKAAVDAAYKAWGQIDVLVNNAGGGADPEVIEKLEEKDWDHIVEMNLKGTYLCTKAVSTKMKKARKGAIINTSSIAGRQTSRLGNLPYASAKAGVIGFTRQLARELGPWGIRVNAIAPGIILTERIEKRWLKRSEEEKRSLINEIPLGRVGSPEDVAQVVVFLASDESGYITGSTIDVNGGLFMG